MHSLNFSEEDIHRFYEIEVFLRNTYIINPIWLKKLVKFIDHAIREVTVNENLSKIMNDDAHYREQKLEVAQTIFHTDHYCWYVFL